MTPWAELLLNPITATDVTVRKTFQALSRKEHPDARVDGLPGPRWSAITAAYGLIKTEGLRTTYASQWSALAGLCAACKCTGVIVKVVGKDRGVRVCADCAGEGRACQPKKLGRKK